MRSRAVIEENLPLGALDFERGRFGIGARLGAGGLTKIDEGEWGPAVLELQRGGAALQYFRGCGVNFRKDGVGADAAEPIASVASIGLLAVQNAVPETAFRSFEILTQGVALIETGKVEPEAAERA